MKKPELARIAWVTRSFLDYHVPVCAALDDLTHGGMHLLYAADYVPERAQRKLRAALGNRAIALHGEWRLGPEDAHFLANRNLSIRFQPGLLKAIHKVRPQVVVGTGFFKWTFAALFYRMLFKTPLVVLYERTIHTERRAQWFRTLYRRLALRLTDAMSCNGRLCKEYTESLGMPSDRITLGHTAADTESMERGARGVGQREILHLRQQWLGPSTEGAVGHGRPIGPVAPRCSSLPSKGLVFLYVGRLIKGKGIAELLKGWEVFQRTENGRRRTEDGERQADISARRLSLAPSTRATLVIVGDGPERENLAQSARRKGLNVQFVGAVDYDRLAPYYVAADAFIIPTLEDNWSLVVPEAMACGLPILCSKYNGCWPELVQEGHNGWVFDPLDPQDIIRCLRGCLRASQVPADSQFQRSAPEFPTFPLSALRAKGLNSREILKGHTPRKAAEAIYRACEIAIAHRRRA